MKLSAPLACSLTIHAALVIALIGYRRPVLPPAMRALTVRVVQAPRTSSTPARASSAWPTRRRQTKDLIRQSFSRVPMAPGTGQVLGPGESGPGERDRMSGSGYSVAQRMTPLEGLELYPLMAHLWKRIGGVILFPDELMNFNFQGRVSVDLVINQEGMIEGSPTVLEAENRYLKVAVLRDLRKLLHQRLVPKEISKGLLPIKITVQVQFRYSNYEPREKIVATPAIDRTFLNFKRYGVRRGTFNGSGVQSVNGGAGAGVTIHGDIETLWDEDFRRAARKFRANPKDLEPYENDPSF